MGKVSESSILASCTPKKPVVHVTMAETDVERKVHVHPSPTAVSEGTDVTYKTARSTDSDTGKKLEFVDYEDVKKLLEDAIAKEERMDNVKLDKSFVNRIDRFTSKDRDSTLQLQLLSEQETRYENVHGETNMTYTFARSYENMISVSITTGKGIKVKLNAATAAKFMGGVTADAEYGKKKSEEKTKGQAKKKHLTISGVVAPGKCVTVKEVAHNVIKTAICDFELIIPEDAQVPFTGRKEEWFNWWYETPNKTTPMKKLLTDDLRNNKCVRILEGNVEFHI